MKFPGTRGQFIGSDYLYSADGSIGGTNTSQLLLARALSRSYFFFQNLSQNPMFLEIGPARATATITSGAVSSFTITNGGFGYLLPPKVRLLGGGPVQGNTLANGGAGLPDWGQYSPPNVGSGLAVLTAGVVSSISVENPGSGYIRAPYVQLIPQDIDARGCADPYYSSANSGIMVLGGGSITFEMQCPVDPMAVVGTSGDKFTCRYMF